MTATDVPSFRELYNEIMEYHEHALFTDVLTRWIEKGPSTDLIEFKKRSAYDRNSEEARAKMHNLYALSRVNDYLLLSFQGDAAAAGPRAGLTLDEYAQFFVHRGFHLVERNRYSPFCHEIVRVEQSQDADEPIRILAEIWPGLMLGDMMFSRAGVAVLGGRAHVVKEVAESSTLYFTHRRLSRQTNDLSMGWGSNSQWRTDFRRDYESDGMRIYNFDGTNRLNVLAVSGVDRDGLTPGERIELCRNRCFVVTSKSHEDLWPFDDRFEELAE